MSQTSHIASSNAVLSNVKAWQGDKRKKPQLTMDSIFMGVVFVTVVKVGKVVVVVFVVVVVAIEGKVHFERCLLAHDA